MSEDDAKAPYAREAAKGEIQIIDELRNATLDQHTEMFKWITASLLAINGGASVSIIGTNAIDGVHKVWAGTNFVIGIFLALMIGVALQLISARGIKPLQALRGYWITVLVDGERDEDLEEKLQSDLSKSVRWSWIVPTLGWISGFFFAAGLAVIAHGILSMEQAKTHKANGAKLGSAVVAQSP